MSKLLEELIRQRKEEVIAYKEYLEKIKQLAGDVSNPMGTTNYPTSLDSNAKRALFDNLEQNEILALALDNVIKTNKMDGWRDGGLKEKKLRLAINEVIKDDETTAVIMQIVKAQSEY
jgi:type I restriction enzyme R subunit